MSKKTAIFNMKITALIGNPVNHSFSDFMFDDYAKKCNIKNYFHLKIEVPKDDDDLLKWALKGLVGLGFLGANITMPFKIKVLKFLDRIDLSAANIGAVNTIKVLGNNLIGFNTDGSATIDVLEAKSRKINKKDHIIIFGAGGAARAIAYEIYKRSHNLLIINRNIEHAMTLIKLLGKSQGKGVDYLALKKFIENKNLAVQIIQNADFVINATPVGMNKNVQESIVPDSIFRELKSLNDKTFFDVILNPIQTYFLRNAKSKGAKIVTGLDMMLYQGIRAFRIWTGCEVKMDLEHTLKIINKEMKQHES